MTQRDQPDGASSRRGLPRRFGRNVLFNYFASGAGVLVGLVTTPLFTHGLSAAAFGVWVLVGAMIPYFEILELGFARAAVAAVARHHAAGEHDAVNQVLNTSFFLLIGPGVIAFGVMGGLAWVLPHVAHIPHPLLDQARVLLLLLGFDMAVSIPSDTFGGALIAFERYDLLNTTLISVLLLQALAWALVLAAGGGLIALGIVTVSISLVGQLARYLLLRRLLPKLTIGRREVRRDLIRTLGIASGWYSLQQVNGLVILTADVIVAGSVVGIAAAGVYAVGQRLAALGPNLVSPALDVFFPHAAASVGRGERSSLRTSVEMGTRIAFALSMPMTLGLVIFGQPAIRAWVGPAFSKAVVVSALLAVAGMVRAVSQPGLVILSGAGEVKVPALVSAGGVTLRVAISIALGLRLGVVGVALGALIGSTLSHGIVLFALICRRFDVSIGLLVCRLLRTSLAPAIAAAALGWFALRPPVLAVALHQNRVLALAVVGAASLALLIVYGLLLVATGLDGEERRAVLGRMLPARART